jgi:hypothetical protein
MTREEHDELGRINSDLTAAIADYKAAGERIKELMSMQYVLMKTDKSTPSLEHEAAEIRA